MQGSGSEGGRLLRSTLQVEVYWLEHVSNFEFEMLHTALELGRPRVAFGAVGSVIGFPQLSAEYFITHPTNPALLSRLSRYCINPEALQRHGGDQFAT